MLGKQHLLFGTVSSLAVLEYGNHVLPKLEETISSLNLYGHTLYQGNDLVQGSFFFVLTAMIGSIFPDIDLQNSTIGRLVPHLSGFFEKHFGHRTIFHDGFVYLVLMILYLIFCPVPIFHGFFFGVFGHLFLDSLTKDGIPLFTIGRCKKIADIRKKRNAEIKAFGTTTIRNTVSLHLLPKFLRCRSDSPTAKFYTLGGCALCIIYTGTVLNLLEKVFAYTRPFISIVEMVHL